MAKSNPNVFSEIFDAVNIFDNLVDLDGSLSGTFKIKRKTNKKGIANVKGKFSFKDDILAGFGFKNISFKDNSSSSLFGDFSDDDRRDDFTLGNPRTVQSGNKKFDYSYNGTNSDILNSKRFVGERKKLVELSVFPEFISMFESKKAKVKKGFFRVSLDDNFAVFGTGNKNNFNDPGNLLMRADFEEAFDLLNPSFDVL
jgi:hypothetical protein